MNPSDPRIASDSDATWRTLHQCALGALPAPTLARLRQARQQATATPIPATPHPGRWRWTLAGVPLALALAIGLHLGQRTPDTVPPTTATAAADVGGDAEPVTLLDENPDLYLWLDAHPAIAME